MTKNGDQTDHLDILCLFYYFKNTFQAKIKPTHNKSIVYKSFATKMYIMLEMNRILHKRFLKFILDQFQSNYCT